VIRLHDDGRVPEDNPFVGKPGWKAEKFDLGHRNQQGAAINPKTGALWTHEHGPQGGDEVNIIRRGGNYGWNVFEGFEPFSNKYRRAGENYISPVFAYTRKYGPSVTCGFVYRANPASSFYGTYIFADYQTARIFALTQDHGALTQIRQIAKAPERAVSFGRDNQGELYVVGYDGTIYLMDFAGADFNGRTRP